MEKVENYVFVFDIVDKFLIIARLSIHRGKVRVAQFTDRVAQFTGKVAQFKQKSYLK